jgi:4-carboxymuconolactone decarboxylase
MAEERSTDRWAQGEACLRTIAGPEGLERLEWLRDVSEEMLRTIVEFVYGDVLSRPVLDLHSRQLCTIAMLAAMGRERQLRAHIRNGLRVGLSKAEITEVMLQVAVYAGFPAALTGMAAARAVFAEEAAGS